jgi:methyl-accepting chemotaxis protein
MKVKGMKLPFWAKVLGVGTMVLVPLCLTEWMLIDQANYKIDFARWEMYGTKYLRPVSRLETALIHYRTVVHHGMVETQIDRSAELATIEGRIDAQLAALIEVDQLLGAPLKTTPEELKARGREAAQVAAIDGTWRRIEQQRRSGRSLAEVDQQVGALVGSIRVLINHMGDSSKLILDPDLDTYYVMDALLLKEPDLIERAGAIADQARDLIAKRSLTLVDREALGSKVALMMAAADGLKTDVDTAIQETPQINDHRGLKPGLDGPLANALSALDRLAQAVLRGVVLAPEPRLSGAELASAIEAARSANALLWEALLDHEDVMLGTRLAKDIGRKRRVVGGSMVVFALMALLALVVGRNFRVLRRTITALQSSIAVLTKAVDAIENHNNAHGDALTRQAVALQETQTTAQQIKQTSQIAAQSAVGILSVAERADTLGRAGEIAIGASLEGLQDIRAQFTELGLKIRELNERTALIGGITQTVKDLADQSNMLALNAAIEAARSGEHGKGFTVVAREIRNLADQSIQATSRVQELLGGIGTAMRHAVAVAEGGGQRIESELGRVKQSGESLRELSRIVQESSQGVRQIAAAVSEQNVGISQIFTAVIDQNKMMDDSVSRLEDTRVAAEQVKSASRSLEDVAVRIQV